MKVTVTFFRVVITAFLSLFLISEAAFSQQIVNHHVEFSSGQQNMWGPSNNVFDINQDITLFEQDWNIPFNFGNIFSIAGFDFGAQINGGFSGLIGSEFSLSGFSSGSVEVDYPIDIVLDMPTDLTYDQGDEVTINTSYTVAPGYELETTYPSLGEIRLDVYFQMAAGLGGQICVFGCAPFTVIPSFDTGVQNLNVLTANQSGIWYLGDADFTQPDEPGVNGFAFAKPPKDSGAVISVFTPWQVHVPLLPVDIDAGAGLSGSVDLPNVETTDVLNGLELEACGDGEYLNLNLEIFQLLGAFVPPPFGTVLSNLSGSQDIGPATVSWNLFSASLDATVSNNQCFTFAPTVNGRYEFPVAVEYSIWDGGSETSSGYSSIIDVEIGQELRYNFPCYFDSIGITPTYSIDGTFRNHTYDEISFDFLMSAFAVGLEIPPITVIPGFTIPEICFTIGYPCGWFDWCTSQICTPEIVVPPVASPNIDLGFGPLFSTSIPLGDISYDWYDNTWPLEGFGTYSFPPFSMEASPLSIASTHTDVSCFDGNDGTVSIVPEALSHALPYTYTWTNGASTQNLNAVPAGSYAVSVVDNNGCQLVAGEVVEQPLEPLMLNEAHTNKSCNGGIDDGTVNLSVSGGTAPYSYVWSNGATSQDIGSLSPGNYSVTVTDANGCTETLSIQITEPAVLTHTAAITHVNCNSGNDGTIDAFVSGGTLPYSYSWSNGDTTAFIDSLTAGTYTLLVTDANGCTYSEGYVVNQPLQALVLSSVVTDVDCRSAWTGGIDITTVGGTAGYSYTWTDGNGQVLPYITEDVVNLPADNYTVVVVDANGCTETLHDTIQEPNAITTTPVLTDILCYGESTGVIDPAIMGGIQPYLYAWSNGATSSILSGVPSGMYTLSVTDGNGCIETFDYTLSQPMDTLMVSLSTTHVLCHGELTGAITSSVSGGTAPYSYSWSNGETTAEISGLAAGNYTLTVTDANGCIFVTGTNVQQPVAPLQLSTVMGAVDCYGNSTGSVDLTVMGGTPGYTYNWWNQQSFVLVEQTEDITDIPVGTYSVVVEDSHGCVDTILTTVTQPEALSITGITDDANCFNLNDGAIDVTTSGGIQPYMFSWNSGQSTEDLSGILAGNYELTVTDQNGCEIIENWTVDQPDLPLEATLDPTNILCYGDSTGALQSTVTGGTMPYAYSWSNNSTSEHLEGIPAGNYTLTVTDSMGCQSFTGYTITEPAELTVVETIIDPSCFAYSDGSIELSINGGVQPYYFNWGDQNGIMINNPSELLDSVSAGEYFIRVWDENGCVVERFINVEEPDTILVTGVVQNALCFEEESGSIDQTVIGGTAPYTFDWSNGATTEDLNDVGLGNYTVIVQDAQGCSYRSSYTVNEPAAISIASNVIEITCIDQMDAEIFITPYGGTPPYNFDWQISQDQNIQGLAPGTYAVTITDDNGCSEMFDFEVVGNENECLIIPNAFTPNGDNYNDTWVLGNIDLYPNAAVYIFNKWGNKLYSSSGVYEPWDGTYIGNESPSATYYYIIELNNEENNKYQGIVTIIR